MKKLIAVLMFVAAACNAQMSWQTMQRLQQVASSRGITTPLVLTFTLASQASPTAPYITAALLTNFTGQVVWTDPSGTTTNSKIPAASFFTSKPGQYSIAVSDWSKVTGLTFAQSAARDFLTGVNSALLSPVMTGITVYNFSYNNTLTSLTVSPLPISVNTLYETWRGCSKMTNAPDVSTLTNVNTLYSTWLGCSSMSNAPAVNTLTNVNTLYQTWYNCSAMTNAPAVNTLTNVNTLQSTWSGCSSITNSVDSIFGDYSGLTNVTTCLNMFNGCIRLSGVGSNFVNATKANGCVTTGAFAGCINLTDYETIPAAYK